MHNCILYSLFPSRSSATYLVQVFGGVLGRDNDGRMRRQVNGSRDQGRDVGVVPIGVVPVDAVVIVVGAGVGSSVGVLVLLMGVLL